MGLPERRAAAAFQQANYPAIKSRIDAAAGFPVPVEVDWDSLALDGMSHVYEGSWTAVYFEPLIAALADIARDSMGRDALRAALRQVVIRNHDGNYAVAAWARFEDGVLTLDPEPTTNIHLAEERTHALIGVLEERL